MHPPAATSTARPSPPRNPAAYAPDCAARLREAGIGFQTRFQPSLAEDPWLAGLDDALAFAERPGRLTHGLALLRSPFFEDEALPEAPGRLADAAERCLAENSVRNTHEPEGLAPLAERLRQRGAERIAAAPPAAAEDSRGRVSIEERQGRDLQRTAAAVARFARYARALAPLREATTTFREGVDCFARFVKAHFARPADDAAFAALEQAGDPSLPDTPIVDPARFRERIRRHLRRQRANRYPGRSGVSLIAAADAPYGDYDCLVLLGVGDADWPGPRPGNIFFPERVVLECATQARLRQARAHEIRLLASFADLPAKAGAFTRAELEDGFPAGESPIAAALGARLDVRLGGARRERVPVTVSPGIPAAGPDRAANDADRDVSPLPAQLERNVPDAVDLERAAALPLGHRALRTEPGAVLSGTRAPPPGRAVADRRAVPDGARQPAA